MTTLTETTWKYGTGHWASEVKKEGSNDPAHEFDCQFMRLSNDKAESDNVIARYVDGDDKRFCVVPYDSLSKVSMDNEVNVTDLRNAWKIELMEDIGSAGKSSIVCLMSSRLLELIKILKLRQRSYVAWPEGVNFVQFAKNRVSKDDLIAAGISSRIVADLIAREIIVKTSAE